MLQQARYNNETAFIVGLCNQHDAIATLLKKIARSACLDQRVGEKCICFSCEAEAIVSLAEGRR